MSAYRKESSVLFLGEALHINTSHPCYVSELNHVSRTSATICKLFFSINIICPFPKIPTSGNETCFTDTPACCKKFTVHESYTAWYPDCDVTTRTGIRWRLVSLRAGEACCRQVKLAEELMTTECRSDGDPMGGVNSTGISVMPYGRAVVNGGNTAATKGGPTGSMAMMALTSDGRTSAITQPCEPD